MVSVQKCPKCGSTDVEFYAGGLTGVNHCKKCGYMGPIFIEEDIPIKQ